MLNVAKTKRSLCPLALICFLASPLTSCKPWCGDNLVREGEECDDGNTSGGDGCSPTCTFEEGWDCSFTPCKPICGDNLVHGSEVCDEGNTVDETDCGYGSESCTTCSADCTAFLSLDGRFCGDAVNDPEEDCDDGNSVEDDSCDTDCMLVIQGTPLLSKNVVFQGPTSLSLPSNGNGVFVFGIPFKPGELAVAVNDDSPNKGLSAAIELTNGLRYPAEVEVSSRYHWTATSTVRWILVRASIPLHSVSSGAAAQVHLYNTNSFGDSTPIQVSEDEQGITLNTCDLEVVVSKVRGTLVESLKIDNTGSCNPTQVVYQAPATFSTEAEAKRTGSYWQGKHLASQTDDALYTSVACAPESVQIDYQGQRFATVRIEGRHCRWDEPDQSSGRYIVRITLAFKSKRIDFQHTFINTENTWKGEIFNDRMAAALANPADDNDEHNFTTPWPAAAFTLKELVLAIPHQEDLNRAVGWSHEGSTDITKQSLSQNTTLRQIQIDADTYRDSANILQAGQLSGAMLVSLLDSSGMDLDLGIAVNNFWERYPTSLESASDAMRIHLWQATSASHTDINLENIPHFWFVHEGAELTFQLPDELEQAYQLVSESPLSKGTLQRQTALGLSLTHDISMAFGPEVEAHLQTQVGTPSLRIMPTPQVLNQSKVFGDIVAASTNTAFPTAETWLRNMADKLMTLPVQVNGPNGAYGLFNYGDDFTWFGAFGQKNCAYRDHQYFLELEPPEPPGERLLPRCDHFDPKRMYNGMHHGRPWIPWQMCIRTGEAQYCDWARASAQHLGDIDTSHEYHREPGVDKQGNYTYAPMNKARMDLVFGDDFSIKKARGGLCDYKGLVHWGAGSRDMYNLLADHLLSDYYLFGNHRSFETLGEMLDWRLSQSAASWGSPTNNRGRAAPTRFLLETIKWLDSDTDAKLARYIEPMMANVAEPALAGLDTWLAKSEELLNYVFSGGNWDASVVKNQLSLTPRDFKSLYSAKPQGSIELGNWTPWLNTLLEMTAQGYAPSWFTPGAYDELATLWGDAALDWRAASWNLPSSLNLLAAAYWVAKDSLQEPAIKNKYIQGGLHHLAPLLTTTMDFNSVDAANRLAMVYTGIEPGKEITRRGYQDVFADDISYAQTWGVTDAQGHQPDVMDTTYADWYPLAKERDQEQWLERIKSIFEKFPPNLIEESAHWAFIMHQLPYFIAAAQDAGLGFDDLDGHYMRPVRLGTGNTGAHIKVLFKVPTNTSAQVRLFCKSEILPSGAPADLTLSIEELDSAGNINLLYSTDDWALGEGHLEGDNIMHITAVSTAKVGNGCASGGSIVASGGEGSGFTATFSVENGNIDVVTITNSGSYTSLPTLSVDGSPGCTDTLSVTTTTRQYNHDYCGQWDPTLGDEENLFNKVNPNNIFYFCPLVYDIPLNTLRDVEYRVHVEGENNTECYFPVSNAPYEVITRISQHGSDNGFQGMSIKEPVDLYGSHPLLHRLYMTSKAGVITWDYLGTIGLADQPEPVLTTSFPWLYHQGTINAYPLGLLTDYLPGDDLWRIRFSPGTQGMEVEFLPRSSTIVLNSGDDWFAVSPQKYFDPHPTWFQ
ncbi:MAG: DUF4215 domain-containing protein [Myxococcota bacterium]|nr:DUF4215 domain-containing protein [Myxococcota bacterium]